jgi:hypothetical protein
MYNVQGVYVYDVAPVVRYVSPLNREIRKCSHGFHVVILHSVRNYLKKVADISNIYCRASFQEPKLSPLVSFLSIPPTPVVLFIANFEELKSTMLIWCNVDTIFRENPSVVSDF